MSFNMSLRVYFIAKSYNFKHKIIKNEFKHFIDMGPDMVHNWKFNNKIVYFTQEV